MVKRGGGGCSLVAGGGGGSMDIAQGVVEFGIKIEMELGIGIGEMR